MKPSIYSLTRQEMIEWAEAQGEKKFRATQIWELFLTDDKVTFVFFCVFFFWFILTIIATLVIPTS